MIFYERQQRVGNRGRGHKCEYIDIPLHCVDHWDIPPKAQATLPDHIPSRLLHRPSIATLAIRLRALHSYDHEKRYSQTPTTQTSTPNLASMASLASQRM